MLEQHVELDNFDLLCEYYDNAAYLTSEGWTTELKFQPVNEDTHHYQH
jgi:hypothetical protein